MRLINICSQGQRKDLPHDDDDETRIFAACFLRQVAGQYLSNMLGDCLHKTSSEIGGRVAPPKNEDLSLVQLHTKLACHSAEGQKKGKQRDNITYKLQRIFSWYNLQGMGSMVRGTSW